MSISFQYACACAIVYCCHTPMCHGHAVRMCLHKFNKKKLKEKNGNTFQSETRYIINNVRRLYQTLSQCDITFPEIGLCSKFVMLWDHTRSSYIWKQSVEWSRLKMKYILLSAELVLLLKIFQRSLLTQQVSTINRTPRDLVRRRMAMSHKLRHKAALI